MFCIPPPFCTGILKSVKTEKLTSPEASPGCAHTSFWSKLEQTEYEKWLRLPGRRHIRGFFALKTAGEMSECECVCVCASIIIHVYEVGKVGDKDKRDRRRRRSRGRLQKVRGRGRKKEGNEAGRRADDCGRGAEDERVSERASEARLCVCRRQVAPAQRGERQKGERKREWGRRRGKSATVPRGSIHQHHIVRSDKEEGRRGK